MVVEIPSAEEPNKRENPLCDEKDYEAFLDKMGVESLNDRTMVINYVKDLFEIATIEIMNNKGNDDRLQ